MASVEIRVGGGAAPEEPLPPHPAQIMTAMSAKTIGPEQSLRYRFLIFLTFAVRAKRSILSRNVIALSVHTNSGVKSSEFRVQSSEGSGPPEPSQVCPCAEILLSCVAGATVN